MNSKDLEAWGRHYDTLLWTVTTIMAVAIGGLLVYVHNKNYNCVRFDVWLAIAGYFLTIVAVYFATSFREARHNVEKHYDEDVKEVLKVRKLLQWDAYLLIFTILGGLWIKLLIENYSELLWLWLIIAGFGLGSIIYCWVKGRGKNR